MQVHTIKAVQKIPISLERAWDFFSNPDNLQVITPAEMRFKVISAKEGEKLHPGQFIEYHVSPFLRIPLYWKTEIIQVKDKEFFIDEQRKGPYRLWRHEHYFKAIEGGVEMTDNVQYQNPGWIAGRFINQLIIRRKLRELFDYRFKKVEELFGTWAGQVPEIIIR